MVAKGQKQSVSRTHFWTLRFEPHIVAVHSRVSIPIHVRAHKYTHYSLSIHNKNHDFIGILDASTKAQFL